MTGGEADARSSAVINRRYSGPVELKYAKSKTTTLKGTARSSPGTRPLDGAILFGMYELPRVADAASRLPSLRLLQGTGSHRDR